MSRNFSALMALAGFVAAMPSHAAADGKAIYQKNCAACHMATGKGIPGAFPALAGNTFATQRTLSYVDLVGTRKLAESVANDLGGASGCRQPCGSRRYLAQLLTGQVAQLRKNLLE